MNVRISNIVLDWRMFKVFTTLHILFSNHPSYVSLHLASKEPASSLLFNPENITTPKSVWYFVAGLLKGSVVSMKPCSCSYISNPGKVLILTCLTPIEPICAQERCHHNAL